MKLCEPVGKNRKGAATLMYFVILLPVIFLIGSVIIDLSSYMMLRTHLLNCLDTSVVSAVNLSMKDDYRSDRDLVLFRGGENLSGDFNLFVLNFRWAFTNNTGTQINSSFEPDIEDGSGVIMSQCVKFNRPSEEDSVISSIEVTVELKDDVDFAPGDYEQVSQAVEVTQTAYVKLPLTSNMLKFLDSDNEPVEFPLTVKNKVGNIRVID